jgi:hypothetical protein
MNSVALGPLDPSTALPLTPTPSCVYSIREAISPLKLYKSFFHPRSLLLLAWTVTAIYIMNIFNAYAYSRMHVHESLPDLLADSGNSFSRLRASDSYMRKQPADLFSVFLTVSSIFCLIVFWDCANVRKLAVVYNFSVHLRTLFFAITGLPPTCIGAPNCPCAVIPWGIVAQNRSIANIAFKYTFGLGLFLNEVPQCGDLTMSGHTVYLWVLALFCLETLSRVFSGWTITLIRFALALTVSAMVATIVLIRNHYTIDILIGTVFTILFWVLYTGLEHLAKIQSRKFVDSPIGALFLWIEAPAVDGRPREGDAPVPLGDVL